MKLLNHKFVCMFTILWVIHGLYMPVSTSAETTQDDDIWYFDLRISDLKFTGEQLPDSPAYKVRTSWNAKYMRANIDGDSEIYIYRDSALISEWSASIFNYYRISGAIKNTKDNITGTLLYPPNSDNEALILPFEIPLTEALDKREGRNKFLRAKERYYSDLVNSGVTGSAWFRHQMRKAIYDRTGKFTDESGLTNNTGWNPRNRAGRSNNLEDTYAIFSGGRAMSENLQLDRLLQDVAADETSVGIDTLPGITINEIDWKPFIADKNPKLDKLATMIPADQYALFFPTFQAMLDMLDEITEYGTPVLRTLEPRSEDAGTRAKYEKQLCLGIDYLIRMLGPKIIKSVAVTGSDPYLRTGSDVAVLFETVDPDIIFDYVKSKQISASQLFDDVKIVAGEIKGFAYTGAVSSNRSISSYLTKVSDDTVIVSNSLVQLANICAVAIGSTNSIASLDEFIFFRDRYKIGEDDETAFLMITDAAIRKLCGPRWRIANSRRIRSAALLAELQAEYLDKLVAGVDEPGAIYSYLISKDIGDLKLTPTGVYSSNYNTLDFMTPVSEMDMDMVSLKEAAAYQRWRDQYQNNWRQSFDPIGIRFSLTDDKIALDITVMPLIENSDYADFTQFIGDSKIPALAGIRHKDTLLNFIIAVDHDAPIFRSMGSFFMSRANDIIKGNPFDWLGPTVSLYFEPDSYWQDLAESEEPGYYIWNDYGRLPVIALIDVEDTLKLTAFLAGVRTMLNEMMSDMLSWNSVQYAGGAYTKIESADEDDPSLYYAVQPGIFILTFNESLLINTLDRLKKEKEATAATEDSDNIIIKPWSGESVSVDVTHEALAFIEPVMYSSYNSDMQKRCWDNLYILNEWKRLYPDHDAIQLHQSFWQTLIVCPGGGSGGGGGGGGEYVWNEKWQTYESTVYGHPAEPADGPGLTEYIADIKSGSFGITFENQGLRAVTEFEREPDN